MKTKDRIIECKRSKPNAEGGQLGEVSMAFDISRLISVEQTPWGEPDYCRIILATTSWAYMDIDIPYADMLARWKAYLEPADEQRDLRERYAEQVANYEFMKFCVSKGVPEDQAKQMARMVFNGMKGDDDVVVGAQADAYFWEFTAGQDAATVIAVPPPPPAASR